MHLQDQIIAELSKLDCDYAFYYRMAGASPIRIQTAENFPSASLIKLPILLAWLILEDEGDVSSDEYCDLDAEAQVEGAGLSWLLRQRRLPYRDVLLLMIALSDNLCANLVMRRAGIERLNACFRDALGLKNTRLERRFMDYEARTQGKENWISAEDYIRLFAVCRALPPAHRSVVNEMLGVNDDVGLWLRNIPRDTIVFRHKTGSMEGILHDWGYLEDRELFLLTRNVKNEKNVYSVLDTLGPLLLGGS